MAESIFPPPQQLSIPPRSRLSMPPPSRLSIPPPSRLSVPPASWVAAETRRSVPQLAIRPVLEHPHPSLSRPSVEVDPMHPATVAVTSMLIATMSALPHCVGLSAPQIGENVRVFVMNVTGHRKARSCAGFVALANPRLLTATGNVVMREGCASIPQFTGDVPRATEVIVTGTVPGNGQTLVVHADAIEARCILHEMDHLDGILFIDRVLNPRGLHPRRVG